MEKRKLGRSGIELPPAHVRRQRVRLDRRRGNVVPLLDTLMAAGINAIDTADVYSVWASGHQGGELEIVIGNWLKRRGKRDDVIIATKVGAPMGSGDKGLSRSWIMKECRCVAEAAADRHHRSVPGASRRSGNAARGDGAGVRRSGEAGQGAGDRRLELHRRTVEVGAGHQQGARDCRGYELLQPHYNLVERAAYRGRAGAAVPGRRVSA